MLNCKFWRLTNIAAVAVAEEKMPIHDWTRVDAGLFHDFHQRWAVSLSSILNAGRLPPDYFALVEQNIRGPVPDVLTLRLPPAPDRVGEPAAAYVNEVAVAAKAPKARLTQRMKSDAYVRKASQITVRHRHGKIVAVIEIVSPGNKSSRFEFSAFVQKSSELLRQGIHLLVIDLLPPGKRDPSGIHQAIWSEFQDEDIALPPDKPLTLVSYDAGPEYVAYVEFVAVGDPLPEMPLFLRPGYYVPTPLEESYQTAWATFPDPLKPLLLDATSSSEDPGSGVVFGETVTT
jgi:hypothetical protein